MTKNEILQKYDEAISSFAAGLAAGLLSPDQKKEFKEQYELFKAGRDALRRTAEDDKARDECRLVVLPCKVGQTVYEVNLADEFADVCEYIVQDVSTKQIMFCDDWYPLYVIGKTVFLSRQEAEAALSERGAENEV